MSVYVERIEKLRSKLAAIGADSMIVSMPESRRYLSGYTASDLPPRDSAGYLFITLRDAFLLTDPRTRELAEAEAPDYQVEVYASGATPADLLADLVRRTGSHHVAFESVHLPFRQYREFAAALAGVAELIDSQDVVDQLRVIKDQTELTKLEAAVRVLDDCFAYLTSILRPGLTEKEVAWEVEKYLRAHGAEGTSFPSIVASGPNAAVPHAVPTDRVLQEGEPIILDIGARWEGYASDMSRTVCMGQVPEKLRQVYDTVLDAQLTAERDIRPGMNGIDADAIARGVIERAGYGDAFIHSTGHGIGLEVHEPPWLSRVKGFQVLEAGMVFSVEPGIYLPGWGGVRIEDLVVMEEGAVRVLTASPKTLELVRIRH